MNRLFEVDNVLLLSNINNELICFKCNEKYKDPRKLKCGHILCLKCINNILLNEVNDDNSCPVCHVGPIQAEKRTLIDDIFSAVDRFNNYINTVKRTTMTSSSSSSKSYNNGENCYDDQLTNKSEISNDNIPIVKTINYDTNDNGEYESDIEDDDHDHDDINDEKVIILDTYRDNDNDMCIDNDTYNDINISSPRKSYNHHDDQYMIPDTYRDADYICHYDNDEEDEDYEDEDDSMKPDNYSNQNDNDDNNDINDSKEIILINPNSNSVQNKRQIPLFDSCPDEIIKYAYENFPDTNLKKRRFSIPIDSSTDDDDNNSNDNNKSDENDNEQIKENINSNYIMQDDDNHSRCSINSNKEDCIVSPVLIQRSQSKESREVIEIDRVEEAKSSKNSNDTDATYLQKRFDASLQSLESTQPPDDDVNDVNFQENNAKNIELLDNPKSAFSLTLSEKFPTPHSYSYDSTVNEALIAMNNTTHSKVLKSNKVEYSPPTIMYVETSNMKKEGDGTKWLSECKRLGFINDIKCKEFNENIDDEILIMEGITIEKKVYVKRTLKYLYALSKGIWIVNSTWLRDSLSRNRLMIPDDYEIAGTEDDVINNAPRKARSRAKHKQMKLFSKYTFSISDAVNQSSKLKIEDAVSLIKSCGGTIYRETSKDDSNNTNDDCNRSYIRLSNQLKKPSKNEKRITQGTQIISDIIYTDNLLSINFLIDSICNQQISYNISPYTCT